MRYYKRIYRYVRRFVCEAHNIIVSPDVTTFAVISTVLVTVIYLI